MEKTLQAENELIITRDGQPVAKLVRLTKSNVRKKRWDPDEHMRWLKKTWGSKMLPSNDQRLENDRASWWEKIEK